MRDLPPSLRLLLKEINPTNTVADQRTQLRSGLLRELQDQSMWALGRWSYADRRAPSRNLSLIAPGDALNPLIDGFKCGAPQCRL